MKTDEPEKGFKKIYSFVLGRIHSHAGLRGGHPCWEPAPEQGNLNCNRWIAEGSVWTSLRGKTSMGDPVIESLVHFCEHFFQELNQLLTLNIQKKIPLCFQ